MKLNIGKYTLEISFGLTPVPHTYPEWVDEFGALIKGETLLAAVKLFKDKTGHGLKDSKDYMDKVKDHYRLTGELKYDFPIGIYPTPPTFL
jgi:hypothetical protein